MSVEHGHVTDEAKNIFVKLPDGRQTLHTISKSGKVEDLLKALSLVPSDYSVSLHGRNLHNSLSGLSFADLQKNETITVQALLLGGVESASSGQGRA